MVLYYSTVSNAYTTIVLKSRLIEPSQTNGLTAATREGHILVQLKDLTTGSLQLAQKLITPVQYVNNTTIIAKVQAGFDPATIDATWIGLLAPEDKISTRLREKAVLDYTLVQVFPGVPVITAEKLITAAGGAVISNKWLNPNTYLVKGSITTRDNLAMQDQISYLSVPSRGMLEGKRFWHCPGVYVNGIGYTSEAAATSCCGSNAKFATDGDGWDGAGQNATSLNYHFAEGTSDIANSLEFGEVKRAMDEWAKHVVISFSNMGIAGTNRCIDVRWSPSKVYGAAWGEAVLANAAFPAPNEEPGAGNVHFNPAYRWSVGFRTEGATDYWDVYPVALHEIGHSLGIMHSDIEAAVMTPSVTFGSDVSLHSDDIAAIKSLYLERTPRILYVDKNRAAPGNGSIQDPFNSFRLAYTNAIEFDTIQLLSGGVNGVLNGELSKKITIKASSGVPAVLVSELP